jgi:hypothetical protein
MELCRVQKVKIICCDKTTNLHFDDMCKLPFRIIDALRFIYHIDMHSDDGSNHYSSTAPFHHQTGEHIAYESMKFLPTLL